MIAPAPARRVHTLRLAAADEGAASRGAFLIEDALRTASLPGGEGGRLLLVRRLALGRILPGQSAASVALAIEQGVWRAGGRIVHGVDPAAAAAPAVYFRDGLEAATALASHLAQGRDVSAWFWPLAVPGWGQGAPTSASLRAVLAATLALTPGPAAVVALADALQRHGHLSALLAALRPEDGAALLAACGWSQPQPAAAAFRTEQLAPPRWCPLLARWLAAWGPADARSLWLAAVALASEHPEAISAPTLAVQAAQVVRAFGMSTGRQVEPVPVRSAPVLAPDVVAAGPAGEAGDSKAARSATEHGHQQDGDAADTVGPVEHPAGQPAGKAPRRPADAAPAAAGTTDPPVAWDWPWLADTVVTRWAGLYLLLPALARLGMAELLAAQPHLSAAGLPQRVLLAVARRLRIPADDAALAPLVRPRPWRGACPFVLPAAWFQGLSASSEAIPGLSLHRMADRPGVRVLSADGLPLALWRGRAPEAARGGLWRIEVAHVPGTSEVPGTSGIAPRLTRGPALPPRGNLAILVYAWETALRRWLARYPGVMLRDVVVRPGRLAVTRTHLDIYFEHAQADVRIRRAGLDLDPGWLPWFGRVVAYHYVASVN